MKKLLASLAFLPLVALAGTIPELNAELDNVLRSLRDQRTEASLTVVELETNETRALRARVTGSYQKTGPANTFRLEVTDATYFYGDGSAPTTHAVGRLDIDLTKVLPRTQINLFVPQIDSLLSLMARQWAKKYGNAVSIKVKTTEKKKDEQGNYISIKGMASFSVDMAKLPAGMKPEEVFAKSGSLTLDVNVTKGMGIDLTLVTNPVYKGFQAEERGLKEILDKLLARDPELLKEIESMYRDLDKNVTPIVDGGVSLF